MAFTGSVACTRLGFGNALGHNRFIAPGNFLDRRCVVHPRAHAALRLLAAQSCVSESFLGRIVLGADDDAVVEGGCTIALKLRLGSCRRVEVHFILL